MKIIKRSGAEAVFDITKIIAAISKANREVPEQERLTPQQIHEAAAAVEKFCIAMNRAPSGKRRGDSGSGRKPDYGHACILCRTKVYHLPLHKSDGASVQHNR